MINFCEKIACKGADNYFHNIFGLGPNLEPDPILISEPGPAPVKQVILDPSGSRFLVQLHNSGRKYYSDLDSGHVQGNFTF